METLLTAFFTLSKSKMRAVQVLLQSNGDSANEAAANLWSSKPMAQRFKNLDLLLGNRLPMNLPILSNFKISAEKAACWGKIHSGIDPRR